MGKTDWRDLERARQKLSSEMLGFVDASKELLRPLKELNGPQLAAMVVLTISMRVVMLAGRPTANLDQRIISQFESVVHEICPEIKPISISGDPCLNASISYISALSKCEDEGKREEECSEAWGPGGQAVMCAMKEIEELRGVIWDLFKKFDLPEPPWPK